MFSSSTGRPRRSRAADICLQRAEVASYLERRDVGFVVGPFSPLVHEEVLEHVGAERFGHQLGLFHLVEGVAQRAGERVDAFPAAFFDSKR